MPRLLLLLPTTSWRAEALLTASRRLGLDVTVGTDRPLVWSARTPERVLALDYARPEAAAETVAEHAREWPFHAVVGADDETTVAAATIARRLGLANNSLASVEAARDKLRQRGLLSSAGLPVPPYAMCRLDEDPVKIGARVGFPCVVKPRRLAASRGVMRADDAQALGRALRRLAALLASPEVGACDEWAETALVESFVPGREVALEGLLQGGRLRTLALFDKPDPLDGPTFAETIYVTPSELPAARQAEVGAAVRAAAGAIGLTEGPVHAELRLPPGEPPVVLEVAARSIGGLCGRVLRFGAGIALEEVVIAHACRLDPGDLTRSGAPAGGVMMLPVTEAGVLVEVRGVEAARAVPGVRDVAITARPGDHLVPLPEGHAYAGFVFAEGATPATVVGGLRAAAAALSFEVRRLL